MTFILSFFTNLPGKRENPFQKRVEVNYSNLPCMGTIEQILLQNFGWKVALLGSQMTLFYRNLSE